MSRTTVTTCDNEVCADPEQSAVPEPARVWLTVRRIGNVRPGATAGLFGFDFCSLACLVVVITAEEDADRQVIETGARQAGWSQFDVDTFIENARQADPAYPGGRAHREQQDALRAEIAKEIGDGS